MKTKRKHPVRPMATIETWRAIAIAQASLLIVRRADGAGVLLQTQTEYQDGVWQFARTWFSYPGSLSRPGGYFDQSRGK